MSRRQPLDDPWLIGLQRRSSAEAKRQRKRWAPVRQCLIRQEKEPPKALLAAARDLVREISHDPDQWLADNAQTVEARFRKLGLGPEYRRLRGYQGKAAPLAELVTYLEDVVDLRDFYWESGITLPSKELRERLDEAMTTVLEWLTRRP